MKQSRMAENIVISKWAGLKGSSLIAAEKEEELLTYFPRSFIDTVKGFDRYISTEEEKKIIGEFEVSAFCEAGEGGVYGALWDLAEETGTGIDVYLRDIPVKQETIEIANYFDFDPYLLLSEGTVIIITENGYALTKALTENGINAAVIGTVTDSNDRVVINKGIRRFLSPRYKDELYKIIGNERSGTGSNG